MKEKIIHMFFEEKKFDNYKTEKIYKEDNKLYKKLINRFYVNCNGKDYDKIQKKYNLTESQLEQIIQEDNYKKATYSNAKSSVGKYFLISIILFVVWLNALSFNENLVSRVESLNDVMSIFSLFYLVFSLILFVLITKDVISTVFRIKLLKTNDYNEIKIIIEKICSKSSFIIACPILQYYFGIGNGTLISIIIISICLIMLLLIIKTASYCVSKSYTDTKGII